MQISWRKNKKLKPIVILENLKNISSVDELGKVSFAGFEKFELDSVLYSMIDFHHSYSFSTTKNFYDLALTAWVLSQKHTAEQFLLELSKLVGAYKRKAVQSYVAVTSISLLNGFPLRRIKLKDSTVECFPMGLPKKYAVRKQHEEGWKESGAAMPQYYCPVVVRVKSKNAMDAMEVALNELDYVRGIFALLINTSYMATLDPFGGSRAPINSIMLGGMHTLHKTSGKPVGGGVYWYDPGYTEIKPKTIPSSRLDGVAHSFRKLYKDIEQHSDSEIIKDAIIRYVRAFDAKDKNVALQRTWAALESLMAAGENNTDLIVRRCSFMFVERAYHLQVLEHLKDYRNRSIHTGRSIENPNDYCYQVQKFFRQSIIFHASNSSTFSSLREANEFLDLPDDIALLQRRRFLIDKAIKFISAPTVDD